MGEIQILTKEQQSILDEVRQSEYLQHFYFTGGTALSTYYLQHRYSEDLDFFSFKHFDQQSIFTIIKAWSQRYTFSIESEFIEVVYRFSLTFSNKTVLRIDFSYYPYQQIEKPQVVDGIYVDSLADIAVNKLFTISQRTNVKDFVDLYFLIEKYTIWDLREGVRQKFKMEIEPLILASDLLKVEDFDSLPKMIKPLTLEELKVFFREKAKKIGGKAVE